MTEQAKIKSHENLSLDVRVYENQMSKEENVQNKTSKHKE